MIPKGVSCLVTDSISIKPFLPPPLPKLSRIPKMTIDNDDIDKTGVIFLIIAIEIIPIKLDINARLVK